MKTFVAVTFAISCFCTGPAFAQAKKFIFKLGPTYELPKKAEDLAFVGNDKDGIVNLSLKKDYLYVSGFNPKTLSQTNEQEVELEKTRNFNSEFFAEMNGKYYWINSDWDKKEGKEKVYCEKVNIKNGNVGEPQLLFETTKVEGDLIPAGFYSQKKINKFDFNYSTGNKFLLVSYRLKPEHKNDKINYDKMGVQVFDENMKKVWGNEFTMPYTEAKMDNSDFSIDAFGNAYLLAKVYNSDNRKEKDKETGQPNYHYELLKFSQGSESIKSTNVNIENYFIRNSSLIDGNNNEMIVACTYSKKANTVGTDGIFLAKVDENGNVNKYKNGFYEFPASEMAKFESARKRRNIEKANDYEAPYISVRGLISGSDGSMFVACEEFKYVTRYRYSSVGNSGFSSSTVYYDWYYDDIIAAKIEGNGEFAWVRKIPKRQGGTTENWGNRPPYVGTMSYKLVADESGYYFLYLDNIKNLELAEDEAPKLHADGMGGQVIVAKLSQDGSLTKELLFDTREEKVMIYPTKFNRLNGAQFIGRCRYSKTEFAPLLITMNK
ncbi:MAG: hypothetical protein JST81_10705 [Bacteroidetes bacterium]|jgi:hypothetical protein|nr:hypothetical protein [Bacteroidota bacterium]